MLLSRGAKEKTSYSTLVNFSEIFLGNSLIPHRDLIRSYCTRQSPCHHTVLFSILFSTSAFKKTSANYFLTLWRAAERYFSFLKAPQDSGWFWMLITSALSFENQSFSAFLVPERPSTSNTTFFCNSKSNYMSYFFGCKTYSNFISIGSTHL